MRLVFRERVGELGTWFSLLEEMRLFLEEAGWRVGELLAEESETSRLSAAIRFWEGEGTGVLEVEVAGEGAGEEEEEEESAVP